MLTVQKNRCFKNSSPGHALIRDLVRLERVDQVNGFVNHIRTVGFREIETTGFDPASVFLSTH